MGSIPRVATINYSQWIVSGLHGIWGIIVLVRSGGLIITWGNNSAVNRLPSSVMEGGGIGGATFELFLIYLYFLLFFG